MLLARSMVKKNRKDNLFGVRSECILIDTFKV